MSLEEGREIEDGDQGGRPRRGDARRRHGGSTGGRRPGERRGRAARRNRHLGEQRRPLARASLFSRPRTKTGTAFWARTCTATSTAAGAPRATWSRADRGGRIVNVTSISGIIGVGGIGAYTAAKGAVDGADEGARRRARPGGDHRECARPGSDRHAAQHRGVHARGAACVRGAHPARAHRKRGGDRGRGPLPRLGCRPLRHRAATRRRRRAGRKRNRWPWPRTRVLVEGLDHPEGVAWDSRREVVWAGGEEGQLYRIDPESRTFEQVARAPGLVLGLAVDGVGRIVLCCAEDRSVQAWDGSSFRRVLADGLAFPNFPAFAPDGTLFVSDSGRWRANDGRLWRIDPDGTAEVFSDAVPHFTNGCAVSSDGHSLDGRVVRPERLALRPRERRARAGRRASTEPFSTGSRSPTTTGSSSVVTGRTASITSTPTALWTWSRRIRRARCSPRPPTSCFVGSQLDRVVAANYNRRHLTILDLDLTGAPLQAPERWAVDACDGLVALDAHDLLPSTAQLRDEFAVSRMTARSAVERLVREGLVTESRGGGCALRPRRRLRGGAPG